MKVKLSEDKKWWIDKNKNRWQAEKYSQEEAKACSATLVNCERCVNSAQLINCKRCVDCIHCNNCVDCVECIRCYDCQECYQCKWCDECIP